METLFEIPRVEKFYKKFEILKRTRNHFAIANNVKLKVSTASKSRIFTPRIVGKINVTA